MGNEIVTIAARQAGAKLMFGYPITPSTEILEIWAKYCAEDKNLNLLQTEDEMSAGFGVIGSCLSGVPAFTATAGPGNILIQDAFAMAEALRIPTVAIITQRGGLSTSTVIYSQEEVRLTCFGGNGEGFRIVYSTAGLQDLYDYTLKSFKVAWKYRLPTFVLSDGYQGKMKGEVNINEKLAIQDSPPKADQPMAGKFVKPILTKGVNFRNCYNMEEEIGEIINNYSANYEKIRPEIEEGEEYGDKNATLAVFAHGIVSSAVKEAVDQLNNENITVKLIRPITLRPFPRKIAREAMNGVQQIIVIESAVSQLAEIVKNELYGSGQPITEINKPAVGFTPEEIYNLIKTHYATPKQ